MTKYLIEEPFTEEEAKDLRVYIYIYLIDEYPWVFAKNI